MGPYEEMSGVAKRSPFDLLVYARHGRELMGWKSPVGTPPLMLVSMPYIDDND
jgi:hypothetical protein